MSKEDRKIRIIKSMDDILEYLAPDRGNSSLEDIARWLNLDSDIVLRSLLQLVKDGYVNTFNDDKGMGRYSIFSSGEILLIEGGYSRKFEEIEKEKESKKVQYEKQLDQFESIKLTNKSVQSTNLLIKITSSLTVIIVGVNLWITLNNSKINTSVRLQADTVYIKSQQPQQRMQLTKLDSTKILLNFPLSK